MSYLKKFLIFVTITCSSMGTHMALAASLYCPDTIKTNQSLLENVGGWDSFVDDWNNEHRLSRITFYSGHPKEHASLAPDTEHAKNNKLTWSFKRNKTWISCSYSNTEIQLIQKLPNTIKTCTIMYEANFSKITAINCL